MVSSISKKLSYRFLRDYIVHIPGENPSAMSLCGTNCFIIGKGKSRVLVEAGDLPGSNEAFLSNLTSFLDDHLGVQLTQILITHGHHDHFGGLYCVLKLLNDRSPGLQVKAYKHLTGN
jgi:endoribonuclease LACTB2